MKIGYARLFYSSNESVEAVLKSSATHKLDNQIVIYQITPINFIIEIIYLIFFF